MKLPPTVKIGPYSGKVTRREKLVVDGDECFGSSDLNSLEIEIATSEEFASEALEASTFLHEALHLLLHVHKINVPDEEDTVGRLEITLLQFLKDNKTLMRSILKALK